MQGPARGCATALIVSYLLGLLVFSAVVRTVSLRNRSSCMLAFERIPDICMDVQMSTRQTDETV